MRTSSILGVLSTFDTTEQFGDFRQITRARLHDQRVGALLGNDIHFGSPVPVRGKASGARSTKNVRIVASASVALMCLSGKTRKLRGGCTG